MLILYKWLINKPVPVYLEKLGPICVSLITLITVCTALVGSSCVDYIIIFFIIVLHIVPNQINEML